MTGKLFQFYASSTQKIKVGGMPLSTKDQKSKLKMTSLILLSTTRLLINLILNSLWITGSRQSNGLDDLERQGIDQEMEKEISSIKNY